MRCSACGSFNKGGRESCWHCGTPLLQIRDIIEADQKYRGGFIWGIAGSLFGGISFTGIFLAIVVRYAPAPYLIKMGVTAMLSGLILGGACGFIIGYLARH